MPEVVVRLIAPVVRVKPFDAVKSPAEVMAPVPVAEILPEVVTASPAVPGERVDKDLLQYPIVLPPLLVMSPAQLKLPLVLLTVHPLDPDPPARFRRPLVPGLIVKFVAAVEAEIVGAAPAKVKAVEVKALEFIVE